MTRQRYSRWKKWNEQRGRNFSPFLTDFFVLKNGYYSRWKKWNEQRGAEFFPLLDCLFDITEWLLKQE